MNCFQLNQITWGTNKRPKQVKAEHRHPTEHQNSRKVEKVAQKLANAHRDCNIKFVGDVIVCHSISLQLDVVDDNEHSCG